MKYEVVLDVFSEDDNNWLVQTTGSPARSESSWREREEAQERCDELNGLVKATPEPPTENSLPTPDVVSEFNSGPSPRGADGSSER